MRPIRRLLVGAFLIVMAGAGSKVDDASAPPLDKASRFLVGTVKADVAMPPEIAYEKLFNEKLTERLKRKKLLAEPDDPNAMVIDSRITQYTKGDLGGRFFSNSGESTVSITSTFGHGGKSLGTVTVQNATGGSMGLYSIGSEAGVIEDAAEILADRLAEKIEGK